jgi:hypothetical protein
MTLPDPDEVSERLERYVDARERAEIVYPTDDD